MKRPAAVWAVAAALVVGSGAVLAQGVERPTVRPRAVIRLSPPAAPTASPGSSTALSTVPATVAPGGVVAPPRAAVVETVGPVVGSYKDIDDYYDDRADDDADEVKTDEDRHGEGPAADVEAEEDDARDDGDDDRD